VDGWFWDFFLSKLINLQYVLMQGRVISSQFNVPGPARSSVPPAISGSGFGHCSGSPGAGEVTFQIKSDVV
jgi:hypothetical protein